MLVVSVQLAMPLALTIAILVASRSYVPTRRRDMDRLTSGVVSLGLVVAAIVAWLRLYTTHVSIPLFNAILGPIVIVSGLVFLVVLWAFRDRELLPAEPTRTHRVLTTAALVSLLGFTVFYGFPYFFGMDGIVIMGNSLFATDSLARLAGYALGTTLVALVSWGYVRSASKVPWYLRTGITSIVFAALLVPRAILLYQQYAGLGFVPRNAAIFRMVLWVQNNEPTMQIVLGCLMALPGIVALWTRPAPVVDANPAVRRLERADLRSRRAFFALAIGGSVAIVATLTKGKEIAEYVPELSPIEPSSVEGEQVLVSRALVQDGHLHRFGYQASEGTQVRFLVIKKNDVAFGTGLDACEICGAAGYYEQDNKVICRNCDVVMNIQTIGFKGGCNPIPIKYEQTPEHLVFSTAELESHVPIFR